MRASRSAVGHNTNRKLTMKSTDEHLILHERKKQPQRSNELKDNNSTEECSSSNQNSGSSSDLCRSQANTHRISCGRGHPGLRGKPAACQGLAKRNDGCGEQVALGSQAQTCAWQRRSSSAVGVPRVRQEGKNHGLQQEQPSG